MYEHKPECEFPPIPADPTFKCEAVVVCVNYSDFLRWTLPQNKQFFEKMVIVTSPEDKDTKNLCEFYHVECVVTERLSSKNGFCKAAGINAGLAVLKKDNWVVHLDADIWLPPQTRLLLQQANLDKRMIFGIDRFGVKGYDAWQNFLSRPASQHASYAYIHLSNHDLPVLTRVMQAHMEGYLPIGFFQMWNPRVSGIDTYPEENSNAAHGDLRFAYLWRRSQRSLIPEIIGYHLESDDAEFGSNWFGRKTKLFEHHK